MLDARKPWSTSEEEKTQGVTGKQERERRERGRERRGARREKEKDIGDENTPRHLMACATLVLFGGCASTQEPKPMGRLQGSEMPPCAHLIPHGPRAYKASGRKGMPCPGSGQPPTAFVTAHASDAWLFRCTTPPRTTTAITNEEYERTSLLYTNDALTTWVILSTVSSIDNRAQANLAAVLPPPPLSLPLKSTVAASTIPSQLSISSRWSQ